MTADAPLIVPLDRLSRDSLELAGGKGANLGELIRGGFPVPAGFVVTTAAYAGAVTGSALPGLVAGGDTEAVRAWFDEVPLAPELVAAVTDAYAGLGEVPVAVRSSATTEDLPGASFAGQQETVLNVRGADAVLRAVRRCWASLWGERAVAYRAQHSADADPQIAVVVQRLVPAEVAGVMFTANPGNGRRDQLVITAAWGLGEAVVAGQVEPDEFVVGAEGDLLERRIAHKTMHTGLTADGVALTASGAARSRQPSLRDEQVTELAELGRAVERHFAAPQDIEWTLAGGRFQLVQSRPVTALPEPVGDPPTEWPLPRPGSMYFRASIVEQLPDPLTPLFAELIRSAVPAGLNALRELLSPRTRPFDVDFPTINGYAYYDYSRAGLNAMWSIAPGALRLLFSRDFVFEQWHNRALPAYRREVEAWQGREPEQLTAADLLRGVRELLAAGCRYYSHVQMVIPMAASSEVIWSGVYHSLLRAPDGARSSDFLLGYDSTPIRAEKTLHRLAAWCRDVPGLADALTRSEALDETAPPEGVDPAAWAELRARLDAHLAEFGHTVYNLDFANPVPADEPGQVVQALRHAVTGTSADPEKRQMAAAERRESLTRDLFARLDPVRRPLAEKSLERAQRWAPHREDALAAVGLAWPVMRRMLHELGRRLTSASAIDDPAEVYWLTAAEVDEAASALDGGASTLPGHADDVAARRRGGCAGGVSAGSLPRSTCRRPRGWTRWRT